MYMYRLLQTKKLKSLLAMHSHVHLLFANNKELETTETLILPKDDFSESFSQIEAASIGIRNTI